MVDVVVSQVISLCVRLWWFFSVYGCPRDALSLPVSSRARRGAARPLLTGRAIRMCTWHIFICSAVRMTCFRVFGRKLKISCARRFSASPDMP